MYNTKRAITLSAYQPERAISEFSIAIQSPLYRFLRGSLNDLLIFPLVFSVGGAAHLR